MSSVNRHTWLGKAMVSKEHNYFKQGRDSIEDDQGPGRPVDATTAENVDKFEEILLKNF